MTTIQKARIDINGREHEFEGFADSVSLIVNTLIFQGKTYPIIDFVGDVQVVMDIGANVGAAAMYFSVHYPDARIYAFEPAGDVHAVLQRNVAHFENVTSFGYGLFDRSVTVELKPGDEGPMTASAVRRSDDVADDERVTLRSIDDWLREHDISRIDVLKLDTEGCEIPILRSIEPLLPSIKVIYVEYHSDDDRKIVDQLIGSTHVLVLANAYRVHRGEMTYVAKDAFPSLAALAAGEIRVDL